MPERNAEGDEVVLDAGEAADESMRADANELMRRRAAANDGEVADLAMAREHHIVGQDDALAEPAVMSDMRIGEEHASRADDRLRPSGLGPRIHRHAFADQTILADDQPHGLAAILQILRRMSDRGEREDPRARADRSLAGETDMRDEAHPVAQRDLGPDMAKGPDVDIGAEPSPVFDDGARMDVQRHSRTSIADTSASHTSAPSTLASPRNHHMLRRLAVRVMWSRTWSPGTTGLRNFALSIVIR